MGINTATLTNTGCRSGCCPERTNSRRAPMYAQTVSEPSSSASRALLVGMRAASASSDRLGDQSSGRDANHHCTDETDHQHTARGGEQTALRHESDGQRDEEEGEVLEDK